MAFDRYCIVVNNRVTRVINKYRRWKRTTVTVNRSILILWNIIIKMAFTVWCLAIGAASPAFTRSEIGSMSGSSDRQDICGINWDDKPCYGLELLHAISSIVVQAHL